MNLNWFFPTTNSENEWCKTFLSTAQAQQLIFSWYLTTQLIYIFLWEILLSFIYTLYLQSSFQVHFTAMQRVLSVNIVWCNPLLDLKLLNTSFHMWELFPMSYWQKEMLSLQRMYNKLFLKNRTSLTLWKVLNLKKWQNIAIFDVMKWYASSIDICIVGHKALWHNTIK